MIDFFVINMVLITDNIIELIFKVIIVMSALIVSYFFEK